MGNSMPPSPSCSAVDAMVSRAKDRMGQLPVEGRYHRLPQRIEDHYTVEKKALGTGYNGTVVSAVHKRSGTKHAVKSFRLQGIDEDKRKEMLDEVEIFLSMDHPHVVRLMEVYESEREISFVMERMEGGELYDRVASRKVFTQKDASLATWHMLLAINYIHSEGIVHRDLKLENFMFESKESDFLKLIDFGFSKFFKPEEEIHESLGTVSYVAPEVLAKSYSGGSADLWSLGVIVFVLLAGYMPFAGRNDATIIQAIKKGDYVMRECRWGKISQEGKDFVKRLLIVNPSRRMTAEEALAHPWIVQSMRQFGKNSDTVDPSIADSFLRFSQASQFQKACMQMMAWTLTLDERQKLRDTFLALDTSHTGVLKLEDLKKWLNDQDLSDNDRATIVHTMDELDCDHDGDIHYSDFLATMMAAEGHGRKHDHIVREAFRRFDTDNRGYITAAGLTHVLGTSELPEGFAEALNDADTDHDGKVSIEEFIAYVKNSQSRRELDVEVAVREGDAKASSSEGNARLLGRLRRLRPGCLKAP